MHFETPSIDDIIKHCIDEIWEKYDDDNNGYLDREETKAFIKDSLKGEEEVKNNISQQEDDQLEEEMSNK